MKLTAENVRLIFEDCLFREDEDKSDPLIAEAVLNKIGFNPGRIEVHKPQIAELLRELPDEFHADKGGGMSFLQACMTRDGDQWGEHINIEQLLALGIASGQAKIQFPRSMWAMLPGGMPYFKVLAETEPQKA